MRWLLDAALGGFVAGLCLNVAGLLFISLAHAPLGNTLVALATIVLIAAVGLVLYHCLRQARGDDNRPPTRMAGS
jgi:hypothetical protein